MWTKENETSGQPTNVDACVFVSYADEDRSAAERVVRALTSLNWRVWWDREIAPGKTFDERISERLRSAGAVVVLWSQHSVVSEWVREEASDAKRRNVLIPALIEHVEPPLGFKLRQAVDLTSWNGSSSAPEFSALAAAVRALITPLEAATPTSATGTAPHRVRRKALPAVTLFALMLAVLLAAGAASGLWFWDAYHRVQLEHFANIRMRYGLPEGAGRLDPAQVAQRNVSLAFIKRGRRNPVDEVRLVNSTGNTPAATTYVPTSSVSDLNPLSSFSVNNPLASDLMTVTRVTFTRDATGRVLEQKGITGAGRLVYTLHYASRDTAEDKTRGFTRPVRASGIVYVRFIRVESGPNAGLDEKVVFLDAAQQPQPAENGAYGYRNTFDQRGLVHESFPLGPQLEDRPNSYGLFKTVASRSQLGDVTEEVYLDQKGARVADRVGVALGRWKYDDRTGNVTRITVFDRSGELVMSGRVPARIDLAYDNRGRLTTMSFFGPDQRPVLGPEGYARRTLEWLSPTRVLFRFYDPKYDSKAVLGLAFEILDTFDERGKETFLDSSGAGRRARSGTRVSPTHTTTMAIAVRRRFPTRRAARSPSQAAMRRHDRSSTAEAARHRLRSFPCRGTPSGSKKAMRQPDTNMMSADFSTPPRSSTRMATRSTPPTDMRWCGANTMRMESFSKSPTSMTAVGR